MTPSPGHRTRQAPPRSRCRYCPVTGRATRSAARLGCVADGLFAAELCELSERPELIALETNEEIDGGEGPGAGDDTLSAGGGRDVWLNVTVRADAVDALPNAVHAFGGPAETSGANAFITSGGLFQDPGAMGSENMAAPAQWGASPNVFGAETSGGAALGEEIEGSFVSDAGTFVLSETALDMHCWGENPVVTAKLQLNGQDRFSEREGSYFDVVQPFQHHTRAPDAGINVYSFALRPEEHQPSGSCNFSRIDNATLQLVLSSATVGGTATAKVRVYATSYNVLRVMSGMAGVAYSN